MSLPVIIVDDPISYDYSYFIKTALESVPKESIGVDVLIIKFINDSNNLNNLLSRLYIFVRRISSEAGFSYKFGINILFNISDYKRAKENWHSVYRLCDEPLPFEVNELKVIETTMLLKASECDDYTFDGKPYNFYNVTAIGGTFDHLHDGHKILLSMSIFLSKKKLIIGMTGPKLLVNKKFSSCLESFETRQNKVINFIKLLLTGSNTFEIYEINDVCGPTGYIRDIDALILSYETIKGGEIINSYRLEHDLPKLDVIIIRVIGDEDSSEANNWKGKLSSTDLREKEHKLLQNKTS